MDTAIHINPSTSLSGFVIECTSKRLKQACQQILKKEGFDITVDQWVLLYELKTNDGLGQNELARKVFKDPPTVTRIIDLLCKKGYITRNQDALDRRKFLVCMTEKGKELIHQVEPVIINFRESAYKGISKKDLHKLNETLGQIFDNLNAI